MRARGALETMIGDIGDRASAEIDKLIERRSLEVEAANREAEAWAESERRYHARLGEPRRQAWCQHHRTLIAVHECLAGRHRAALGRLIDTAAHRGPPAS